MVDLCVNFHDTDEIPDLVISRLSRQCADPYFDCLTLEQRAAFSTGGDPEIEECRREILAALEVIWGAAEQFYFSQAPRPRERFFSLMRNHAFRFWRVPRARTIH